MVITSLAGAGKEDPQNFQFVIKYKGKEELFSLPDGQNNDWMDNNKKNSDFSKIALELRKKNLISTDGIIKKGVSIERRYERVVTNFAVDLLLEDNQKFINSILNSK